MVNTWVVDKAQDSPEKYLEASISPWAARNTAGKERPFNQQTAVKVARGWLWAAGMMNAKAFASVPLRLYVRKRAGEKLFKSRGLSAINRHQRKYLSGGYEYAPSGYVTTKSAEWGDDFEQVTDTHPLTTLLSRPNPFMTGLEFWTSMLMFLQFTGNYYVHPVLSRMREAVGGFTRVDSLWTMPSQFVKVIPGDPQKGEFVAGYVYGVERPAPVTFAPDEVGHLKLPSMESLYYGTGVIQAGWDVVKLHLAQRETDQAKYDNHARPDLAVITKSANVTGDKLIEMQNEWARLFRGSFKQGNPVFLTGETQVIPLNWQPSEIGDKDVIVEEIAAITGVPVSMLKANDPNLASSKTGFAQWRENTILPYCRMVEEFLNMSLLPIYGIQDDAFLCYDNPVPENREEVRQEVTVGAQTGSLTLNERRARLGEEPIQDPMADKPLVPAGFVPLDKVGQPPASPFTFAIQQPEVKTVERVVERIVARGVYDHIDFTPPEGARDEARKGLAWRDEYNRGGTEVGIARARDIANGKNLSPETINRMVSFFARHEVDKKGEGWNPGEDGYPSNGRIAWALWGGEPGKAWANKVSRQMDAADDKGMDYARSQDDGSGTEGARDVAVAKRGDAEAARLAGAVRKQSDHYFGRDNQHGGGVACCGGHASKSADDERDGERLKPIKEIAAKVGEVFNEQRRAAVAILTGKKDDDAARRIQDVLDEIANPKYAEKIREAVAPYMTEQLTNGATAGLEQIDVSRDVWNVENPKVSEFIRQYTVKLSTEVNAYTATKLSDTLGEGLAAGESPTKLSQRVGALFDDFDGYRTEMIARTESARAYVAGTTEAWKQSEVVKGKRWLLANSACPICSAIAAKFNKRVVKLDEPFMKMGATLDLPNGGTFVVDYSDIQGPPGHPHCRCGVEPVM